MYFISPEEAAKFFAPVFEEMNWTWLLSRRVANDDDIRVPDENELLAQFKRMEASLQGEPSYTSTEIGRIRVSRLVGKGAGGLFLYHLSPEDQGDYELYQRDHVFELEFNGEA
jgi:hypothetical protein